MVQDFGDQNLDCFLTYLKILKHEYFVRIKGSDVSEYWTSSPDHKKVEC